MTINLHLDMDPLVGWLLFASAVSGILALVGSGLIVFYMDSSDLVSGLGWGMSAVFKPLACLLLVVTFFVAIFT